MIALKFRSPWVIAWIAMFLFVTVAFGFRKSNELIRGPQSDSYMKAANRYLSGGDVYVPPEPISYWPYPPAMLLTVAPLAFVPELAARILWGALLATCVIGSGYLITTTLLAGVADQLMRKRIAICLLLAVAVSHQHILSPLTYYSHDFILVLCLAIGFAATVKRKEIVAGCAFGIGAALKVTPGLFFPILLIQRRWKALVAMFCAGAILTVAPDVLRPQNGETVMAGFYRIAMNSADVSIAGGGKWPAWNPLAQNLSATISRWTMKTPPGEDREHLTDWAVVHLDDRTRSQVTVVAFGIVLGMIAWVVLASGWKFNPKLSPLTRMNEIGAVACGMVLLAPHSSNYHFAVIYFAIASCIIAVMKKRDPFLVVICIALCLLGLPSGRDLIGHYPVQVMLVYGKITCGALFALAGCARVAQLQRRERAAALSFAYSE